MREYEPGIDGWDGITTKEMIKEVMEIMKEEKEDIKIHTTCFSFIANVGDSYKKIHKKYNQASWEFKTSATLY